MDTYLYLAVIYPISGTGIWGLICCDFILILFAVIDIRSQKDCRNRVARSEYRCSYLLRVEYTRKACGTGFPGVYSTALPGPG